MAKKAATTKATTMKVVHTHEQLDKMGFVNVVSTIEGVDVVHTIRKEHLK